MENTIILHVTEDDIRNSSDNFANCTRCILSTAAKRQFSPTKFVGEGEDFIFIDDDDYSHRYFGLEEWEELKANPKAFDIELTKTY